MRSKLVDAVRFLRIGMEAPVQHYDAVKLRVDVFRKMNFDWKHPLFYAKDIAGIFYRN